MPLHIQNGFCPVLLCDHCGELISEARTGSALWLQLTRRKTRPLSIYFIHNTCDTAFERTVFTEEDLSQVTRTGLNGFLTHLIANAEIGTSEAQVKAELLQRLSSKLVREEQHAHARSARETSPANPV